MSSLTQDLIKEILLWLPVKSLVRFQSVSKSWLALIKDPNFIETQLQRSIQAFRERILILWSGREYYLLNLNKEGRFDKPTKFIQLSSTPRWMWLSDSHCNGLFCKRTYKGGIVIWNPSIRKHKKLPPVKINVFNSREKLFSAVIGYDVVNNDYKVVIIVQFEEPDEQVHVLIYSLKENSWRRVKDKWPFEDFVVGFGNFALGYGNYLNGNMNWLVQTQCGAPNNQTFLVTFDLTNEKFQVHPIPVKLLCEDSLKVLEGKLCARTNYLASIMEESGVVANSCWMLEEYGVASSWSLLYSQPSCGHNPLVISVDGQEILIQNHKEFYWYDRKKKTQTNVKNLDTPKDFWVASSQESLLLIDGHALDSYVKSFNVDIGYDPVNNDYKVVNIIQFEEPVAQSDVFLYSLKENSWRRVEDEWPFKNSILGPGASLNGNMNWLVQTEEVPNSETVLVTFDLANEKFQFDLTSEKFQAHLIPTKVLWIFSLRVLEGKLCACTTFQDLMEEHEVETTWWVMEEYGVASNWSLLYTLPFFLHSPLMISEDGQEILIEARKRELFGYDKKKKTQKNVKILDILEYYWATSSQGSLLLIDSDNDDDHSTLFS